MYYTVVKQPIALQGLIVTLQYLTIKDETNQFVSSKFKAKVTPERQYYF
jgi:hypothetical protein